MRMQKKVTSQSTFYRPTENNALNRVEKTENRSIPAKVNSGSLVKKPQNNGDNRV